MALFAEDPWGEERADLRTARIAEILFNTNAKKGQQKKLTDFMPFYREKKKAQEDVTGTVRSWFNKVKDKL